MGSGDVAVLSGGLPTTAECQQVGKLSPAVLSETAAAWPHDYCNVEAYIGSISSPGNLFNFGTLPGRRSSVQVHPADFCGTRTSDFRTLSCSNADVHGRRSIDPETPYILNL